MFKQKQSLPHSLSSIFAGLLQVKFRAGFKDSINPKLRAFPQVIGLKRLTRCVPISSQHHDSYPRGTTKRQEGLFCFPIHRFFCWRFWLKHSLTGGGGYGKAKLFISWPGGGTGEVERKEQKMRTNLERHDLLPH